MFVLSLYVNEMIAVALIAASVPETSTQSPVYLVTMPPCRKNLDVCILNLLIMITSNAPTEQATVEF